jgi:hypothetical protein
MMRKVSAELSLLNLALDGLPSSRTVRRSGIERKSKEGDIIGLGVLLEALGVGEMSKGANARKDGLGLRLAIARDERALLMSLAVLVEDGLAELSGELDADDEQESTGEKGKVPRGKVSSGKVGNNTRAYSLSKGNLLSMVVSIVLEMMVTPLRGGRGERAERTEGGEGGDG